MALPSVVFFLRCSCGIKFRIVHVADGKVQALMCECEQEIKIYGTAKRVHAGKGGFGNKRSWFEVPAENIKAA